jgi:hypothetical protein
MARSFSIVPVGLPRGLVHHADPQSDDDGRGILRPMGATCRQVRFVRSAGPVPTDPCRACWHGFGTVRGRCRPGDCVSPQVTALARRRLDPDECRTRANRPRAPLLARVRHSAKRSSHPCALARVGFATTPDDDERHRLSRATGVSGRAPSPSTGDGRVSQQLTLRVLREPASLLKPCRQRRRRRRGCASGNTRAPGSGLRAWAGIGDNGSVPGAPGHSDHPESPCHWVPGALHA